MLEFIEHPETYEIIEKIHGWNTTRTMTVHYKKDLSESKINNEPWRSMNQSDKDWFNKYHLHKFKGE